MFHCGNELFYSCNAADLINTTLWPYKTAITLAVVVEKV
jgi:hypothetical protein